MPTRHFIVTGTSRGIGEQLAKLLLDQGDFVYGISRGIPESLADYTNYRHRSFDLSRTAELESMLQSVIESIAASDAEVIGLVNNAAMLEPLQSIDRCTAEEIERSLQISLTAPIILSSSFIKLTEGMSARRKIVNISFGLRLLSGTGDERLLYRESRDQHVHPMHRRGASQSAGRRRGDRR